jgi:hypothetical protein
LLRRKRHGAEHGDSHCDSSFHELHPVWFISITRDTRRSEKPFKYSTPRRGEKQFNNGDFDEAQFSTLAITKSTTWVSWESHVEVEQDNSRLLQTRFDSGLGNS